MRNKSKAKITGAQVGNKFMGYAGAVLDVHLQPWTVERSERKKVVYNALAVLGVHLPRVMFEANRILATKNRTKNRTSQAIAINYLMADLINLSTALNRNLTVGGAGEWEPRKGVK